MITITIDDFVYNVHPLFDLYAANKDGYVVNIIKKVLGRGNKMYNGYMNCNVRKHGQNGNKTCLVHRFMWECFNSMIPEGMVIDYINDIKDDNRLCNLQLVSQQQNCLKSTKDRDFTYITNAWKNRKCVKAMNCDTQEFSYYNSTSAVEKHLGISHGTVKRVCDGCYGRKTGRSKKDGHSYKFEYVPKENMPDNYKKSADLRPRMTDDERKKRRKESEKRWGDKAFVCPKCGESLKNRQGYYHKKICR